MTELLKTEPVTVSRRHVLVRIGSALTGVAAAMMGIPVIGFIVSGFSRPTYARSWVSLGSVAQFPENETRLAVFRSPWTRPWDGDTAKTPCWVRRIDATTFQVFAINCTHLGCPVRWFPQSRLFMCPCHGGVFYEDGSHASGPPPRGLFEYPYQVDGGNLMIRAGYLPTLAEPL